MRILVGNISAVYTGRSDTVLAPYDRVVVYKSDGSVSIHGDKGFKPMNYMTATNKMEESFVNGELVMSFISKKEQLVVTFHKIYDEINLDLGVDDPGHSQRLGNEIQLQKYLSERMDLISPTMNFVQREYQTGAGPVDILGEETDGTLIAVEVKRTASIAVVGQTQRYIDALKEKHPDKNIMGVVAAVSFKGKTVELAEKKNILCVVLPENWVNEVPTEDTDTKHVIVEKNPPDSQMEPLF